MLGDSWNIGGLWAPAKPPAPYQGMHISTMCPVQMVLASLYPERYPTFISPGVEYLGNLCRDLFRRDVLGPMYARTNVELGWGVGRVEEAIPWGADKGNRGHVDIVLDYPASISKATQPLFGSGRIGFEVKSTVSLKRPETSHVEQSLRYMHIAAENGEPFDSFWIVLVDKADIARSTAWPVTLTERDSERIGRLLEWASTVRYLILEGQIPREDAFRTQCTCSRCFKTPPQTADEHLEHLIDSLQEHAVDQGVLSNQAKLTVREYADDRLAPGESFQTRTGWTIRKSSKGSVSIRYKQPALSVISADEESN